MSTQNANGSDFSIAVDQQPFRLLELPPELLELLTTPNPPKFVNPNNLLVLSFLYSQVMFQVARV